jgi:phosphatidylglycerophosphate synthase
MQEPQGNVLLRNVANVVSILGVLPLCILFRECGYQYLIALIVCNNIMDDLDGVLAVKLDIKSE